MRFVPGFTFHMRPVEWGKASHFYLGSFSKYSQVQRIRDFLPVALGKRLSSLHHRVCAGRKVTCHVPNSK